jgi:hypothetical protein
MPGDPQECRANATRCIEFAAQVKYPDLKETFLELAKRWTALAIKLEKARARKARTRPKKPKGRSKLKSKKTSRKTSKKTSKRKSKKR